MHRLILWTLFVVTLFQAERTFVIDRIVEIVALSGARRGGGALELPRRFGDRSRGVSSGSPELVRIQWDYRPRGILVSGVDAATTYRRASQGGFSISWQDSRAARERPASTHDVDVRIAEDFERGKRAHLLWRVVAPRERSDQLARYQWHCATTRCRVY